MIQNIKIKDLETTVKIWPTSLRGSRMSKSRVPEPYHRSETVTVSFLYSTAFLQWIIAALNLCQRCQHTTDPSNCDLHKMYKMWVEFLVVVTVTPILTTGLEPLTTGFALGTAIVGSVGFTAWCHFKECCTTPWIRWEKYWIQCITNFELWTL